jgi:membrane protease YdiL (CAAX protease family)
MPDRYARPLAPYAPITALPAMALRDRLTDAVSFIARPTHYPLRHAWSRVLLIALAAVFVLDLATDWLVWALIDTWDQTGGFLPNPVETDMSFAEDVFTSLLIAPLIEEALYRGWLSGRIAALRFAVFGFVAEGCFIASLFVDEAWAQPLAMIGAGIALIGFVQWLSTRHRDTAIPAWFTRNFHWLVWGSCAVFALAHLGNSEPLTHPLGALVVAPQLIGGLFLAYVRTRLGLRAAIAHHAAYNALVLLEEWG